MKFLEKLRGRARVEDLDAAQAETERERATISARLAAISAQREAALLEGGEAALGKLDDEAEGLRRKLEICELAASGLAKRRAAAAETQQRKEDEEIAAQARDHLLAPLIIEMQKYHAAAVAYLSAAQAMARYDAELQKINLDLIARGRADLTVAGPWASLHVQLVRFAKETGYAVPVSEAWQEIANEQGVDAVPAEAWVGLPDCPKAPDLRRISIPGYYEAGVVRWQQPFRFA